MSFSSPEGLSTCLVHPTAQAAPRHLPSTHLPGWVIRLTEKPRPREVTASGLLDPLPGSVGS